MSPTPAVDPDERRDESATVLLSGGLDSGTALALWLGEGSPERTAHALFVDYGQRAVEPEAAASSRLAQTFGVSWQRIEMPWLGTAAFHAGSALVTSEAGESAADLPRRDRESDPGDRSTAAAVWVPARNLVLCSAAAAIAEARGDGVVVAGFNREEAATFADNSAAFLDAMTAACAHGTRTGVRVVSPTLALEKPAIVARARSAGLGPADFWSCYDAGPQTPCGHCESCVRAKRAWRQL